MSVDESRKRLDKLMSDCKKEAAELIPKVEKYLRRDGLSHQDIADLEFELSQLREFHDRVAVPDLSADLVSIRVSRFNGHKATLDRLMK